MSSVPFAFSRPILLRVVVPVPPPPSVVKAPPTKILPSACTARALTAPFAPGLKLASIVPSGLSRPMKLRVVVPVPPPPRVVKNPATKILPSACTARAWTMLFAPGSKLVSSVPSAIQASDVVARGGAGAPATKHGETSTDHNLAVRLHRQGTDDRVVRTGIEGGLERAVGMKSANLIARGGAGAATAKHGENSSGYDLPSACTARARAVLFAPGLKLVSSAPSGFKSADLLRAVVPVPPPPSMLKCATDQNLSVRLHREDIDRTIRTGIKAQCRACRPH